MPALALLSKPKGEPMARTHSPTRVLLAEPILTAGRSFASIFRTATSLAVSRPSTLALNSRLSLSLTMTSSAPSTTWALVRIVPSGLTMKPDPRPRAGASPRFCGAPKRRRKSGIDSSSSNCGDLGPREPALRVPDTLMLTTEGLLRATMLLMSGKAAAVAASGWLVVVGTAPCDAGAGDAGALAWPRV
ncbi:MAG: hypothetical protein AW07_04202 [Candidatus Accumulibacter sp. SK-11]|nr:MAG: hypothetical protein AW07_04202 [Candidatus Accumulibacter sp. SK-11]